MEKEHGGCKFHHESYTVTMYLLISKYLPIAGHIIRETVVRKVSFLTNKMSPVCKSKIERPHSWAHLSVLTYLTKFLVDSLHSMFDSLYLEMQTRTIIACIS